MKPERGSCTCVGRNRYDHAWGWTVWELILIDPWCIYHGEEH